jgi:hypothetical protein
LDASFTFQWLFEDEATPEGDVALAAIRLGGAAVPALWPVEITNVLGIAERRGRLTPGSVIGAEDVDVERCSEACAPLECPYGL